MGDYIYRATVAKEHHHSPIAVDTYRINYKDSKGKNKSYRTYSDAAIATNLINKYFTDKTPTITSEQSKKLIQEISTTFSPKTGGQYCATDWYTLLRDAVNDFLSDDQKITPDEIYQIYERIDSAADHRE